MNQRNPHASTGQPSGTAPAADPSAGGGIQPGGITPELEEALQAAPDAVAAVIRDHMAQTSAAFTDRMMRTAEDVRIAGSFRTLAADPEFQEYLRAKESGDLAGFHRRKAGVGHAAPPAPAAPGAAPVTADNLGESPPAPANGAAVSQNSELAEMRSLVEQALAGSRDAQQTVANVVNQRELERFQSAHPDWQDYSPLIIQQMQATPGISYEDAYVLAKHRSSGGAVPDQVPAAGGAAPAPGAAPPAPPPPAVSTGAAARAVEPPPKFSRDTSRGVAEAFEHAQKLIAQGRA